MTDDPIHDPQFALDLRAAIERHAIDIYGERDAHPGVRFDIEATHASYVGTALYDFDREMRRAVAFLREERASSPARVPSPIRIHEGGLLVDRAEPGSLSFFMTAYDQVAESLRETPIETLVAFGALVGVDRLLVKHARGRRRADKPGELWEVADRELEGEEIVPPTLKRGTGLRAGPGGGRATFLLETEDGVLIVQAQFKPRVF
jgi:hypothetical protein